MKLNKSILIFELKIWRVNYFFRRPPRWKIISVSVATKIVTYPRRPSIQLKKSFTRLKIAFHETAQEYFLSSNFDNVLSTFFVDHLDEKLPLFHNLLGLSNSLLDPHFIWKCRSLVWISLFRKLHKSILIFELKIWRINYFFRRPPRWKFISVSVATKIITYPRRPSIQLKKSFTRLKIAFHETAQEYFLSSNFDNVLSTFFVHHLDEKLPLFHNLLGLSHSLVDPHFIWKSPSLDWISLFMKLNKSILIFELKFWRVNYFFRRPLKWKIISVSVATKIITYPRTPSIQLKKSFTRLKIAFHETAQEFFLSSKFDNVLCTFFLDHLDGKLALFHNLLGLSHSLVDPHFIWKIPSLDWISLFMKLNKSILIFELKIWRVNYFFRRPLRWKIISVSVATGIITYPRTPSIQLKKSFTRLKIAFHETAQEYFLSSNFDNVLSTFCVDHLDGKLALFHNLLGLSHSLVDPHFIWKIPSLDWISLFMKLNKSILIFELKFWRVNYFFRRPLRWKIISVSVATKIITYPRTPSIQLKKSFTRLKIAFHETAQECFLSSNFDNVLSTFFVDHLDEKSPLFHNLLGLSNSLVDPHLIWKCRSLVWISLFMKTHKSILIFELKIWRVNYFYRRPPRWKIISVSVATRISTYPRRPSIQLKMSFTRLKIALQETAQEYFWARNLTTC